MLIGDERETSRRILELTGITSLSTRQSRSKGQDQGRSAPAASATFDPATVIVTEATELIIQRATNNTELSSYANESICFRTLYRARYSCPSPCNCACHQQQHFGSSNFLHQLLGSLFIGYTGLPLITPQCTSSCQRRSAPMLLIRYYFPMWLLLRLVWLISIKMGQHSLKFSLEFRRTVPNNADVFHVTACGDIESLRVLFGRKKASPMDVDSRDGRSAFHLSHLSCFLFTPLFASFGFNKFCVRFSTNYSL
jgi:hypothetical protein